MGDLNIQQLIERAKNGDKSAVDEIYREYSDTLTKFVMKQGLTEFDAQDVVSDTFVEMMKHIDQLKESSSFNSWIHTIAKRKAWEAKEKASRRQDIPADPEDDDPDRALELAYEQAREDTVMLPEDYAVNEDIKQIITEQLEALSPEYKEALFLFYYKNKSIAEIAELTGTNANNAKVRLFNARKKLKANLEKLQKAGVVLCAVPLFKFIPENAGKLETATAAGAAAKAATTAAKSSTAVKSGIAAKVAAAVIAAGVVAGGVTIAVNRSDKKDKDHGGQLHAAVQKVPDVGKDSDTSQKPQLIKTETNDITSQPDWKAEMLSKLTEEYGDASGLKGIMYDTDGDDIPEYFIYGKASESAKRFNTDKESNYLTVGTRCLYGYSEKYIRADTDFQPTIWCSGDPSENDLLCVETVESRQEIFTTKEGGHLNIGMGMSAEEAKSIYDFDSETHRLIADETTGFEEIGDFAKWIESWNGNYELKTEDAPLLSCNNLNVWQNSYFEYIDIYANHHNNVRCGLYDVNADGVPELLLESYIEVTDDGKHIGSDAVMVTCDSSGERDSITSADYNHREDTELVGGLTFTGQNENVCTVNPLRLDENTVQYTELRHRIVDGHFEYDGGISDTFNVTDKGFVYFRGKNEIEKDLFMESHTRLYGISDPVTTCPASFDKQANIKWFDNKHRIDMFIDNLSKN
ncbi:RNA polymerase sigma factor [Ruminococcus albus]|uniref:RNA polymerase sigma factor, sigma-70 family n=1 Tax=Ruminococcus albus TaxID=1264 RepID=A0A1I1CVK3_RUMAL|nr:RNA polymerase sigma factor [Ruminococcus albus]SFB66725.1 RNA polymerase sigma factor, sigma-70 family [Ruminococcus albus]